MALCSIEPVRGRLRATSDMSACLQIIDVLLGCVQFEVKSRKGSHALNSRRASEKNQLVSFLTGRLDITSGQGSTTGGDSPDEWHTPSVFTVSQGVWRGRVRL